MWVAIPQMEAGICNMVHGRQEVLPIGNIGSFRIRTSFLAGGREREPARKLVLILKMLLFLPGNTSSLGCGDTVLPAVLVKTC